MTAPRQYRQSRFQRPPGACELLIIRHGESAPADPEAPFALVDGHGDPPLHEPDGVEQAERVAERLLASDEVFAAVYVTNLRRTVETAQPFLTAIGMEPTVEPDLREVHLGDFEGGELRKRPAEGDPVMAEVAKTQRWDAIPGAEPADAFAARVRGAVTRIAEAHPDETVAVFTHGGVIGQIFCEATGAPGGFTFTGADNASISHVVVSPDQWFVRRFNDTAHLGPNFTELPEALT